jgi:hypothetical protein
MTQQMFDEKISAILAAIEDARGMYPSDLMGCGYHINRAVRQLNNLDEELFSNPVKGTSGVGNIKL